MIATRYNAQVNQVEVEGLLPDAMKLLENALALDSGDEAAALRAMAIKAGLTQ